MSEIFNTFIKALITAAAGGLFTASCIWIRSILTKNKTYEKSLKALAHDSFYRQCRWLLSQDSIVVELLSIEGDTAAFILTNETGSYFDFDIEGISFNGYTTSYVDFDLCSQEVLDNSQIYFEIKMDNDFKEENNMDTIEEIEFYLLYRPLGDYFNEAKTGTIKAKVE